MTTQDDLASARAALEEVGIERGKIESRIAETEREIRGLKSTLPSLQLRLADGDETALSEISEARADIVMKEAVLAGLTQKRQQVMERQLDRHGSVIVAEAELKRLQFRELLEERKALTAQVQKQIESLGESLSRLSGCYFRTLQVFEEAQRHPGGDPRSTAWIASDTYRRLGLALSWLLGGALRATPNGMREYVRLEGLNLADAAVAAGDRLSLIECERLVTEKLLHGMPESAR